MRSLQTLSGLFLAAVVAGLPALRAQEEGAVRAGAEIVSRQVFRGLEMARASTQADVGLSRGNWRAGAWANLPFSSSDRREFDLSGGYSWRPSSAVSLEASIRGAWWGRALASGNRDALEAGLVATFDPLGGITPGLGCYHDFRREADTVEATFAYSIPLAKLGTYVDLSGAAGWVAGKNWRPEFGGAHHSDGYRYWALAAQVPYRVGPHSTVIIGAHYADADGHSLIDGAFSLPSRRNFWMSLGVSLDF